MIERCAFGHMVIDGTPYRSDLIIYPDGKVIDGWRRRKGHRLCFEDVGDLVESAPEVIVAGTGMSGLVIPEKELEGEMSRRGIKFTASPNEKAAELYNKLSAMKKVGACFHLAC